MKPRMFIHGTDTYSTMDKPVPAPILYDMYRFGTVYDARAAFAG